MKRAWLLAWALLIVGILCVAQQQRVSAYYQSRDSNYNISVSTGATYTGPLDINGTPFVAYSTRGPSSTFSGALFNVCDQTTGLVCADATWAAGTLTLPTLSGQACSIIGCEVAKLYDVSGASNCSAHCDQAAAHGSRANLITSCQNGLVCFACTSSSGYTSAAPYSTSHAQPVYGSWVGNRTTVGAASFVYGDAGIDPGYSATANQLATYAGNVFLTLAGITDNANHAIQVLINGASSTYFVDGSSGGTGNPGGNAVSGTPTLCISGQSPAANLFEFYLWGSDKSSAQATLNNNQHTYWNF